MGIVHYCFEHGNIHLNVIINTFLSHNVLITFLIVLFLTALIISYWSKSNECIKMASNSVLHDIWGKK